jgi:hypothetical protein
LTCPERSESSCQEARILWEAAWRRAFSFPIHTSHASMPHCMSRRTRSGWRRTTPAPRSGCRRQGRRGPSHQGTRPVPTRYSFWGPHWFVSPGESHLLPELGHSSSSRSNARIRHRVARCRQCPDRQTGTRCTLPRRRRRRQRIRRPDPVNAGRRRLAARKLSQSLGIHHRSGARKPSRSLGIRQLSGARRLSRSLVTSPSGARRLSRSLGTSPSGARRLSQSLVTSLSGARRLSRSLVTSLTGARRSGHAAHSLARRYLRIRRG